MRKTHLLKNPVAFLCLIITACSLAVLIMSLTRLPETPPVTGGEVVLRRTQADISESYELGVFGRMMIEMLPEDLVFTAFVPSDRAFATKLGLEPNKSRRAENEDNQYAVVSRVLGFSVVPYKVEEGDVGEGETVSYESLCGYTLNVWRKKDEGGLVVNGVETKKIGIRKGKILVHLMNGVIMDAEFAQSFGSVSDTQDDEEEDE
ncbi:PREDICTED: uncharacterized protein LOC104810077 [Tarenaya hassleriana]|uniref:uncharacterized protein LOC104810077 n=1 Tax=Tarenaya hassleriana TaxID=28532 RepID=UPI00053C7764|nr:PREDICTED: uncharacterized protein LOC104810077 [Tarenaya hassleriana]